jgi:hypothetical protein
VPVVHRDGDIGTKLDCCFGATENESPGTAGAYCTHNSTTTQRNASRSRFAFYDYLAAVFELYVRLRRTRQVKKSARLIAKLFGLRKQNGTHPIRVIIDATSRAIWLRRRRGVQIDPDGS